MKVNGELIGQKDGMIFSGKASTFLISKTQHALKLSAMVVEKKAKELCPVDTGRLKTSIAHRVLKTIAEIGTIVYYAIFVEFGTVKMRAQSFLRAALDIMRKKIIDLFRKAMREAIGGK